MGTRTQSTSDFQTIEYRPSAPEGDIHKKVETVEWGRSSEIVSDHMYSEYGPEFLVQKFRVTEGGLNWYHPEDDYSLEKLYTNYLPATVGRIYSHLTPTSGRKFGNLNFPSAMLAPSTGDLYITQLLAATNPGRPEVSLPAFLGEGLESVRGLPENLMREGHRAISSSSRSNLGIRFGILPLVSDVLKLTRLSEAVDKRSSELVRLSNNGGAKVKRVFFDSEDTMVYTRDEEPELFRDWHLTATSASITTRSKLWATCRWKPTDQTDTIVRGSTVNRQAIRSLLLGIGKHKDIIGYAADAWQLVPWSWMGDWFSNFGDYLEANSNQSVALPSEGFLMKSQETSVRLETDKGPVSWYFETKQRVPGKPSISALSPVLNGDQMSILTDVARQLGSRNRKKYL